MPSNDTLTPAEKEGHINAVRSIPVPHFYPRTFARWREALAERCTTVEVELTSRLLIGHGEPSPTEVGLTLHPTYGVPYLPGPALKGLLSHHIQATRGGRTEWRGPVFEVERENENGNKSRERAPLGDGNKVVESPGDWYATLFGAPPLTGANPENAEEVDAQGYVQFEDALLVPDPKNERPLVQDVVTPHHSTFYSSHGAERPVDWDDPIPVSFLTVAPGTRFLLAVGHDRGADAWAEFALEELLQALETRGIGAKTSAGYGRARRAAKPIAGAVVGAAATSSKTSNTATSPAASSSAPETPEAPLSPALQKLQDAVAEFGLTQEAKLDAFDRLDFPSLIVALGADEHDKAWDLLNPVRNHRKVKRERNEVLVQVQTQLGRA